MKAQQKDSVLSMVVVLTITCFLAGIGLSYTFAKTKDSIAVAETEATLEAVKMVMPVFEGKPEVKTILLNGEEKIVYIGKEKGNIIGIALESSASGYGGTLSILVGIDVDGGITGIKLLAHHETPGLGTKAGDQTFLKQFRGEYLRGSDDRLKVVADGGRIQAITAATITSRAVATAATEALRLFNEKKEEIIS